MIQNRHHIKNKKKLRHFRINNGHLTIFQIRAVYKRTVFHFNKFFLNIFLASGEILQYFTMILQRPRIIVGDAGFAPGTSAPEV